MRRTIVITAWVVLACVAWLAVSMGGLRALQLFDPGALQSLVKAVPDLVFLGHTKGDITGSVENLHNRL